MSAAASERRSSASRIVRHSASSVRPQAVGGVLAVIAAWGVSGKVGAREQATA